MWWTTFGNQKFIYFFPVRNSDNAVQLCIRGGPDSAEISIFCI